MSAVSRTYTFVDGTDAFGSQIENEFNTIYNAWNNHDAGVSTWTTVKVASLESTLSTILQGTATNDSALAGDIGEYISSTILVASAVNAFGASTYGDVTSISLTAGDWDVDANIIMVPGTTQTGFDFGIGTSAGNVSPAADYGLSLFQTVATVTTLYTTGSIARYRVSISATTTYYLKAAGFYTVGTPKFAGTISARRIR